MKDSYRGEHPHQEGLHHFLMSYSELRIIQTVPASTLTNQNQILNELKCRYY